jgi:hypothetical protein
MAQEWESAGRFHQRGAMRRENAVRDTLPVPSVAEWTL